MFSSYDIVVTNNKNELLVNRKLDNNKIYSLSEFISKLYFSYDVKTIYYVMNKYNVIYDIAKIYLNNIRYIEDKKYNSDKLNFLKELKSDLISNNLIKEDNLFKKYISDKKILFYDIEKTKELEKLDYSIEYKNIDKEEYNHIIYEFNTRENEVLFVVNKICELVSNGIDINNIYLVNLDDEYKKVIRRIFPMFNIGYNLVNSDKIYGTFLVSKFIELYDNDMNTVLEKLSEYINSEEDQYIYDSIVKVLNKYVIFDNYIDIKELVIEDLKNINIKNRVYDNAVNETNKKYFNDDEYVFLLGFNQGIIPKIYKDEEYLNDKEKEELGISLTIDKNIISKNISKKFISRIKNLFISYKLHDNGEDYKISSLNEELKYEIVNDYEIPKEYSNKYNRIYLGSLLDEYNKYGTKSEELYLLDNTYKDIEYNSYSNKFSGINKELLKEYLNNKLLLSYSSIDKYYRCPFSYYIGNILKLNVYEETFYQIIGTLFHSILEKCLDNDFEELWDKEIKNLEYEFNIKEEFFLKKLKKELEFVIETIKYQETLTDLHNELHEEKIYTSLSGDMSITFMGIIDKIKYKELDGKNIVAIIDYKTGNTDIDLGTLPYGIGMQLPVYLYLANRSNKLTNVKVVGFYIQKILNTEITNNEDDDYEKIKRDNLKLRGFSSSDTSILSYFDNSYESSQLIKSMKVKKDGDFSSYSKVLSDSDMNKIDSIVSDNIEKAANLISDAKFDIEPKRIDKINMGCMFCKYKDICYRANDDIVDLKKVNQDEVLGDNNGMD